MDRPVPRKSGGPLKWILLGCGGLIILAVAFFAVTGYLIARNFTTDPAKAESAAQEILTFEKPAGFKGAFSMSVMGLQTVMLTQGEPDNPAASMIMISSFPAGAGTQEQYQTQIDANLKQQGQSREVAERRPPETFKVRGQDATAQVNVVRTKDGSVQSLQYTLMLESKPGRMAMVVISGPEKTTDHAFVQKFLDTIK